MTDAILTLNAGSSTIKLGLFDADASAVLATGLADRVGGAGSFRLRDPAGRDLLPPRDGAGFATHAEALATGLSVLRAAFPDLRVRAVGHRVVHGGPDHAAPARITPGLLDALDRLVPLAPLHQPHNLAGVRAAVSAFPGAVHVACFDTAFHRGHPRVHDLYALPRRFHDQGIRRYGFHGLSYTHIAEVLARDRPDLGAGRVVAAHLGNGASMCAMRGGRSVSSTMGFTALDGLVMGSRPGQIDPGVMLYLFEHSGLDLPGLSRLLYHESGLLGLSGLSGDMRTLLASDAPEAAEAVAVFAARVRHETGALAADLGGIDALVFTGGIGENAARVRAMVCEGLDWMGIVIDPARNAAGGPAIGRAGAGVEILVVPADEEGVIARAAAAALAA